MLAAGLLLWVPCAIAGGWVIYKDNSFDDDSQAEIAHYSSYERFPSVDNITTRDGQMIRILPSQSPIYIPEPDDPSAIPATVLGRIVAAERRFPQFAGKLEALHRAWAAPLPPKGVAASKPTPKPRPAPTIAPTPAPQPAPTAHTATVLHTLDGSAYYAWRVIGMEGDTVIVSHTDGVSRISISNLPDNLFGFPPEVFTRAAELRLEEAARIRKAADNAAPHEPPSATATPPGKTR